jgi:polyphosphate kinase 2 (PPK2 family)
MNPIPPAEDHGTLVDRIRQDLLDGYDEELELEIEDRHYTADGQDPIRSEDERSARMSYFKSLFHLQGELVKLQDWVQATGQKVVILFEGGTPPARAA